MTFSRWFRLLLMAWTVGSMGVAQSTEPPKTIAEVFDRSVSAPERATLTLAEKMPESGYNFVPRRGEFKGVRTFAQLAKHIAVIIT